jgi:ribonuclease HIII
MHIRLIFTISIFLPTLAVYVHEFSHHEHQACQDSIIDFHEYEEVCCLDNFIFNKIYSSYQNDHKFLVFLFNSKIFEIEVLNQNKILLDFFNRGPPSN